MVALGELPRTLGREGVKIKLLSRPGTLLTIVYSVGIIVIVVLRIVS